MLLNNLNELYFNWICQLVIDNEIDRMELTTLLRFLDQIEFTFTLAMDENRAIDGVDLRYRFCYENNISKQGADSLASRGPCSVLEMMAALALKCEEEIMSDSAYGNRISKWFMTMIDNLKLCGMVNSRFDPEYVYSRVSIMLNREYEANGDGGLFRIDNCRTDLRTVDIWYQMCWYLNTI